MGSTRLEHLPMSSHLDFVQVSKNQQDLRIHRIPLSCGKAFNPKSTRLLWRNVYFNDKRCNLPLFFVQLLGSFSLRHRLVILHYPRFVKFCLREKHRPTIYFIFYPWNLFSVVKQLGTLSWDFLYEATLRQVWNLARWKRSNSKRIAGGSLRHRWI